MIKVLIVDDEPLARENLRVFLQEQSDIEIVGECSNAVEGIGAVHKLRPDVLFLDIQMPRISGLEMVGMLDPEHRPYIVFLTAFFLHRKSLHNYIIPVKIILYKIFFSITNIIIVNSLTNYKC